MTCCRNSSSTCRTRWTGVGQLFHRDDEVEVRPLVRVGPGLVERGDEHVGLLGTLALERLEGGRH